MSLLICKFCNPACTDMKSAWCWSRERVNISSNKCINHLLMSSKGWDPLTDFRGWCHKGKPITKFFTLFPSCTIPHKFKGQFRFTKKCLLNQCLYACVRHIDDKQWHYFAQAIWSLIMKIWHKLNLVGLRWWIKHAVLWSRPVTCTQICNNIN